MSMTTELIKALRLYANMLSDKASVIGENTNFMGSKIVTDAANTIEGLSSKLHAANMERSSQYYHGGWIPVGERLPEYGEVVLWCNKHGSVFISAITYQNGNNFEVGKHGGRYIIKAWRPLPEPYSPNEEEVEDAELH